LGDELVFHFDIDGEDFTSAGQASVQIKKILRQLGLPSEIIRRVSIAMYEGEINMVIHADGGDVEHPFGRLLRHECQMKRRCGLVHGLPQFED
jgi:hypothetical protein